MDGHAEEEEEQYLKLIILTLKGAIQVVVVVVCLFVCLFYSLLVALRTVCNTQVQVARE